MRWRAKLNHIAKLFALPFGNRALAPFAPRNEHMDRNNERQVVGFDVHSPLAHFINRWILNKNRHSHSTSPDATRLGDSPSFARLVNTDFGVVA